MKIETLTQQEWLAKGEKLFGEDVLEWEFVCPSCGHVQKPEDFRPYKDKGADPNTAFLKCIGRYDGHGDNSMGSGKKPCNYTSAGLLNINPVKVVKPDGKEVYVFAFNDPKKEKA